jgi:hypothetical protein
VINSFFLSFLFFFFFLCSFLGMAACGGKIFWIEENDIWQLDGSSISVACTTRGGAIRGTFALIFIYSSSCSSVGMAGGLNRICWIEDQDIWELSMDSTTPSVICNTRGGVIKGTLEWKIGLSIAREFI